MQTIGSSSIGYQTLKLKHLRLDKENPRLPERLKGEKVDEKNVLNWMLEDSSLLQLMASIAENGFFPGEPIIVLADGNIVLEGNRRLASLKLLQDPSLASENAISVNSLSKIAIENKSIPIELQVFVVKTRKEVDNYIAFRHVTGIKNWPVISKARYTYRLFIERIDLNGFYPEIYKEIAREIGSKAAYVRRMVQGYDLYLLALDNRFFGLSNLNEDSFALSLITDSLDYSNIAQFVGFGEPGKLPSQQVDKKKFEQLFNWLYNDENAEKRPEVGESREIKILSAVLGHEQAREFFLRGNALKEAALMTDVAESSLREAMENALAWLKEGDEITYKVNYAAESDLELINRIMTISEGIFLRLNKVKNRTQKPV